MLFYIETLGCKVNQYESAAIAELLRAAGHTEVSKSEPRDVSVVNSCAVTGDASRQSRQAARKLRREFPTARLVVCGCASQIEPSAAQELGADLVTGAGERRRLVETLEALLKSPATAPVTDVGDAKARRVFEPLPSAAVAGRTRAMLKIQDGCDNYCTYCVIPYARGHVRSLSLAEVVQEAQSLAEQGFAELVLTGIELCSYGKDLDGVTLVDAVNATSRAAMNARIRLGSLEPSTVTQEFVDALTEIPGVCDHFHMSLQSGSDGVLRRMRRKYDTAQFYAAISRLREAFPSCGITADVIAGFPGETVTEHAETLAFLERCAFSDAHVFPYSKRPGTPAAAMENQLPNAVKKARAAELRAVAERTRAAFVDAQVGKTLNVLFEREAGGVSIGHTSNYLEIAEPIVGVRGKILPIMVTKPKIHV